MNIDGFKRNAATMRGKQEELLLERGDDDFEMLEAAHIPERKMIAEHSKDVFCHWQAPEFEKYEADSRWYAYIALVLAVIVGYSIWTNSLIMSITFILIGVVGYMYIGKEPRILDFMVTEDGVVAGKEIFKYERIKSFWIFYEPGDIKVISLHIESLLTPYVHIPIHDEDPVVIREVLLRNVEEIKQEHNVVDTLERLLRI